MSGTEQTLPIDDIYLSVSQILTRDHYLGPVNRGFEYRDEFGVMVFANPTSRNLPQYRWLELVRWCLRGVPNGGSRQWKRAATFVRNQRPEITTIVSYSDPSVGHTGALYRACNWQWAPTWHRLREPPSGNGSWGLKREAVKDRWVYRLRSDDQRERLLMLNDESLRKKYPWAEYTEERGGDYKRWLRAVNGE